MRVYLKSGEYLDYYDIKRVEILDNDVIKIKGNFDKRGRSKTHETYLRVIKNIREVNRFLRKEMKFFRVDGSCPHCDSLSVVEVGMATYSKKLNKPKEKVKYEQDQFGSYTCKVCNKTFQELKYVNLVIYTK